MELGSACREKAGVSPPVLTAITRSQASNVIFAPLENRRFAVFLGPLFLVLLAGMLPLYASHPHVLRHSGAASMVYIEEDIFRRGVMTRKQIAINSFVFGPRLAPNRRTLTRSGCTHALVGASVFVSCVCLPLLGAVRRRPRLASLLAPRFDDATAERLPLRAGGARGAAPY